MLSARAVLPRGRVASGEILLGTESFANRDGVRRGPTLEGEAGGVESRNGGDAAGDSGLRKGELRGEP
jgi:hypothetical protein